jgi:hypothetical protein
VPRETVADKARRYLAEGRLELRHLDPDRIEATCRGDGTRYRLGHDARGWWCDCPHPGRRCSHLQALRLVTVRTAAEVTP